MRPLYNLQQNIFLWASPKCGSSTIRDILCQSRGYDFDVLGRNLQGYPQKKEIYDWIILNPLLYNQDNNINIAFIRNPYDRFISGVFQKHIEGDLDSPYYKPKSILDAAQNIDLLDTWHFKPQTSDMFQNCIKFDQVFDIENIDYQYLSSIFGKEIKKTIKNNQKKTTLFVDKAYLLEYHELVKLKKNIPSYNSFYNQQISELIEHFYAKDFVFADQHNITYKRYNNE